MAAFRDLQGTEVQGMVVEEDRAPQTCHPKQLQDVIFGKASGEAKARRKTLEAFPVDGGMSGSACAGGTGVLPVHAAALGHPLSRGGETQTVNDPGSAAMICCPRTWS